MIDKHQNVGQEHLHLANIVAPGFRREEGERKLVGEKTREKEEG